MGQRSGHSIKKYHRELELKKKAKEKMARRQRQKDQAIVPDEVPPEPRNATDPEQKNRPETEY